MPIRLELVFDLTQNKAAPQPLQQRYSTALDMSVWADQAGFQAINFGEHHNNEFNYLSSPIVMGAAAGARTKNIQLRMILLTPFYNPLRLAEDLAVASLLTQNRAFAVLAAGYRRIAGRPRPPAHPGAAHRHRPEAGLGQPGTLREKSAAAP